MLPEHVARLILVDDLLVLGRTPRVVGVDFVVAVLSDPHLERLECGQLVAGDRPNLVDDRGERLQGTSIGVGHGVGGSV